jgi:hypothetical protein
MTVYLLVFFFYGPVDRQIISAHTTRLACEAAMEKENRDFGWPICQSLRVAPT